MSGVGMRPERIVCTVPDAPPMPWPPEGAVCRRCGRPVWEVGGGSTQRRIEHAPKGVTRATADGAPVTQVQPIDPLLAQLIEQQVRDSQNITNRLVDSLQNQLAEATATLDAVRFEVGRLLSGDYMPTSAALQRALWPTEQTVNRFRAQEGTEA